MNLISLPYSCDLTVYNLGWKVFIIANKMQIKAVAINYFIDIFYKRDTITKWENYIPT